MAISTGIPSKDHVTNLKAPKSRKNQENITITTEDNTSTIDKDDTDKLQVQKDTLAPPSNDFVGNLRTSTTSPALGNDFLTAHHIFGDYIRKHEVPRKVFHSSIGFITLYLYTKGVHKEVFPIPFHISFTVIFTLDLIRLRWKYFNYLYCQVVGFLMREKEINSYNGVLWYILGLDVVFSFFPKDICLLSVLLLSWSDTAASTFGRAYGKYTPKIARGKSLAGSIAAFTIGIISSYLVYGYFIPEFPHLNQIGEIFWTPESSYLNLHTMSLLSGFVAALSEGIDLFNWDDNFTIPALSSIFFYIVITIFHK
ncbi:CTP-dependent diacylglycerol kinase 1 [Wickerhamomyces ciferrii]|uniref:CTP-dependent diacylglycerol kinase 1 n=1 Tax=Wickerhamomyces ciferrii (strain ATCC 14091 / BCRC 22168 / CBS 111 / JCM 3599 / NBRC 0793 / NRRL Y-1031 F-60-10) TaxID=1206466 RepID=K0KQA2_WICCF|nr:CTP-dependent diacylglycerol kinase 1 [Wickerhamomyces ciferrii]CCH43398.1 CTP-dependent diacylglycerol kinase 1 [Wickerhamomyces ciferrii]